MFTLTYNQKGFAAFFVTILVLAIMLGLAFSITILVLGEQRISKNIVKSTQAYYIAETGIEDAILRLKENPTMLSLSYNINVGQGVGNVDISDTIGGSRVIISQGNIFERSRKIRVVYAVDTDEISFHYGAQVGEGGMDMGNNARIKGNVFSNGSVIASSGKGYIDNSIIVAHNGNKIKGLQVGEDATVHTCENSTIIGDLIYVSGGSIVSCPAGGIIKTQPNEIEPKNLPISQNQIDSWKADAFSIGVINEDVFYSGASNSLGPIQIGTTDQPKNLTVTNNSHLKVTGTIYVTGNIIFSNNSIIELDAGSYGSLGGVIIADEKINISNGSTLRGSGQPGSYILILSTNNSLDPADPAILVSNNAEGAIFYTTSGLIYLSNNMKAREITGYKIKINNNAEIEYESGLQEANFSSGPGGSWQIKTWEEIE